MSTGPLGSPHSHARYPGSSKGTGAASRVVATGLSLRRVETHFLCGTWAFASRTSIPLLLYDACRWSFCNSRLLRTFEEPLCQPW